MFLWFFHIVPHHRIIIWKKYLRYMIIFLRVCSLIRYIILSQYIKHDKKSLTVYIDASLSMMTSDIWGQSRFEIAQSLVSQLSQILNRSTIYDLYLIGAVPVPIESSIWFDRVWDAVSRIDPHRLILKSWFMWSLLYHTWSYHTTWNDSQPMIIITDGAQTTGSYLFTGSYTSIIIGIGSTDAWIGEDLWGRPISTSLDQEWLIRLANQTQSHLFLISSVSDLNKVVYRISNILDQWWQSHVMKIWLILTLIWCAMIIQSIYQAYLYNHIYFNRFNIK